MKTLLLMEITRGFCTISLPIRGICYYRMKLKESGKVSWIDTELMDGFFGWLDEVVLNLKHVKNACLYYLINSPDDKGKKEETGKELNRLEALCNYKQLL